MAVQNPGEGSQCYPIAPSGRWKASADVMRTMDHKRRAACGNVALAVMWRWAWKVASTGCLAALDAT